MVFPKYEEIELPLLCLIYQKRGEIKASGAYQPLADYFNLTQSERVETRKDGRNEPLWNNKVQWARRKLNDYGYLVSASHGI